MCEKCGDDCFNKCIITIPEGPVGESGLEGAVGQEGPPGQDGQDGNDGLDGLDGNDGQDGNDGADGLDGNDGQDGNDGADGLNFHQGNGVPSPAFGEENESYLDALTGDIYKKIGGSWILTGSISNYVGGSSTTEKNIDCYGFSAYKTTDQPTITAADYQEDFLIFEDDINAPYYDNGNCMFITKYIVPKEGLPQRFVLENLVITMDADYFNDLTITLAIRANTTVLASEVIVFDPSSSGEEILVPTLSTSEVTLNKGDIVNVIVQSIALGGTPIGEALTTLKAGAKFSNTFGD